MYILNEDYIVRFDTENDEYILYNSKSGEMKLLNKYGAYIYNLISKKLDKNAIISNCSQIFKNEAFEIIEKDINTYISTMLNEGVIKDV